MRKKYVTLVGTRDVSAEIADLQIRTGGTLTDCGWTGRSGLAIGSDTNFFHGALMSPDFMLHGFQNFCAGRWSEDLPHNPNKGLWQITDMPVRRKALILGIGARGTDRGLGKGGLALHGRNPCQVLGPHLTEPSRFLVCHAKPVGKEGKVDGGTNTAVALALHFKIDVINTYTDEGRRRIEDFLAKNERIDYAKAYRRMEELHGLKKGT